MPSHNFGGLTLDQAFPPSPAVQLPAAAANPGLRHVKLLELPHWTWRVSCCDVCVLWELPSPALPRPHLLAISHHHIEPVNMRFTGISSLVLLAAGAVQAASSWSFDEGSVSISSKKAAGEATKEK